MSREKLRGTALSLIQEAEEVACALGHEYIGTEHLLLGGLTGGPLLPALRTLQIEPQKIRDAVHEIVTHCVSLVPAKLPLTPNVKYAISDAAARWHSHNWEPLIAEDILLELPGKRDTVASQVLKKFGVTYDKLAVAFGRFVTFEPINTESLSRESNVGRIRSEHYPEVFWKPHGSRGFENGGWYHQFPGQEATGPYPNEMVAGHGGPTTRQS